jgi:hypothetical protein
MMNDAAATRKKQLKIKAGIVKRFVVLHHLLRRKDADTLY